MALRKNSNPTPMQLHPELQGLLVRNGMQANIMIDGQKPFLVVRGHDSPILTYELTSEQVKRLTDWGSNFSNKTAYNTFTSLVKDDFDMPKDFVHARNANGRVAMGLHGYRIGAGEYGRPENMSTRQALIAGMPLAPRHCYGNEHPRGFLGRLTGWLGWTPRQQDGFHLRRVGGELHMPGGAPIVPDRLAGRMKPGELQSGGYGFYYKGQAVEVCSKSDPLKELQEAFIPTNESVVRASEPAKPYKDLISSPVYFTAEKFQECLSSHGIVIDVKAKSLTIQPEQTGFDLKYDLTDEEVKALTSNSLKDVKLEERIAAINRVIDGDFEKPITMEMLNSNKRIDIPLKPDTLEEVSRQSDMISDKQILDGQAIGNDLIEGREVRGVSREMPDGMDKIQAEPTGKVIPIVTEMEGHHWEQDVRGGRDVVLKNVVAYEDGGKHYLRAEVNGEPLVRSLTDEQFNELHYRTDEVRIELVDKLLDGISFKQGDYKGEAVNASTTDAFRLSEIKDSKGWFREGKDGREVSVGRIGVQVLNDRKYVMTGVIDGEVVNRDISKKEYDKFLAMDDYHRMRMFSKLFDEVDMKERLDLGSRISAALAAGITVMGELTLGQEPDMRHHRHSASESTVRPYYKPGVDSLEEVAMRNFEAAINTENLHNGLRK